MNIVIIDDDKLASNSLKTIIESDPDINVLAIGNSGKDAINLYENFKPDVLLMDIRMNDLNGLEAAEIILKKYSNAKILFLTTFEDKEYISKALQIGVRGYILKQNFESIVSSLKAVYLDQIVFGGSILSKIPDIFNEFNKDNIDLDKYNISQKEFRIIELVANGLNNKEISNILYLSEGSLRNCISIILNKLDLRDRTQLAIFYYKYIK